MGAAATTVCLPALNPVSICFSFFPPFLSAAPTGPNADRTLQVKVCGPRDGHGQVMPCDICSAAQRDPGRPPGLLESIGKGQQAGGREGRQGVQGRRLGKVPITVGQGQCSELVSGRGRGRPEQFVWLVVRRNLDVSGARALSEGRPACLGTCSDDTIGDSRGRLPGALVCEVGVGLAEPTGASRLTSHHQLRFLPSEALGRLAALGVGVGDEATTMSASESVGSQSLALGES